MAVYGWGIASKVEVAFLSRLAFPLLLLTTPKAMTDGGDVVNALAQVGRVRLRKNPFGSRLKPRRSLRTLLNVRHRFANAYVWGHPRALFF